ncbi:MAG: ABC transporter permease [Deltaproteobacteria bacterium]|nr:ABC transporter permease [Deltaproteobacteria bacterium]
MRGARPDWLVVARRELMERLRNKWFIAVTLLGPIFMVVIIAVPILLALSEARVRVAIVDRSAAVAPALEARLAAAGWSVVPAPAGADGDEAPLLAAIRDDHIDGFVVVPADALAGGLIVYKGDNATSQQVAHVLYAALTSAVQSARGAAAQIPAATLQAVLAPVAFTTEHTTGEPSETSGMAAFVLGYAVMMLIYLAIVLYGAHVLRSVIVEKTSRVAEIMVAAAKPRALMLGKIIGVGGAGLVQMGIWLVVAALVIAFREPILGALGVPASFALPPLGADGVVVALLFFFFGFFFYASLFASIGAMVSSDQEAQSAQTPLILLLIVPVLCVQVVAGDPRGGAAEVLTQIPFSSPMLMPMRYLLGGAGVGQVAIALVVLIVSTWLATRAAARIYRIGLLAYGKRPTLRELWRWLRQP